MYFEGGGYLSKLLVGTEYGSYTFDPINKQIYLVGFPPINMEQLLIITNATDNTVIYNFASPALNGSIDSNNVITLQYDTTAMSANDRLQIYLDMDNPSNISELFPIVEQYTYDTNMERVLGSQPLTENGAIKAQIQAKDFKKSAVLMATNHQIVFDCEGWNSLAVQMTGNFSGTVAFEGSLDGTNYAALGFNRIDGAGYGSFSPYIIGQFAGNSVYRASVAAIKYVRIRISAYTSGTAWVVGELSMQVYTHPLSISNNTLGTADTYLSNSYRSGGAIGANQEYPSAPTVNPSMPGSYTAPIFANWPQIYPRIRVEDAGDKRLPFAQEANSNKQHVVNDDERQLLERILVQLLLLNQNLAQAYNLPIPPDVEGLR